MRHKVESNNKETDISNEEKIISNRIKMKIGYERQANRQQLQKGNRDIE
jgi:hypothetical protein